MRKTIGREYAQARRKHDLHAARHHRCGTAVGIAVNSYLGEKSDPPQPLQGRRAINRVIAKTLATPLALVFTPLYTAVVMPAILAAVYPTHNAVAASFNSSNTTAVDYASLHAPAHISDQNNHSEILALQMGLSAMFGLPLIMGYVARNQFIAPRIEKGIAYLEALCGRRDTTHSSESDTTSSNHHASLEESTEVSLPSGGESEDDTDSSSRVMSSNKRPSPSQSHNQNEEDYASSIV